MADIILVPIATIKEALFITVEKYDDILERIVLAVSMDFQKTSGRGVDLIVRTEYFDVEEYTRKLYLKGYPVDTGEDFEIFQDLDRSFGAETEIDSEYYFLDAETGIVELFQRYPTGRKTIKVTYTGGMAKMESPDSGEEFWTLFPEVADAVLQQVIAIHKGVPNLGAGAVKINDSQVTVFTPVNRLPIFQREIINNMRGIV